MIFGSMTKQFGYGNSAGDCQMSAVERINDRNALIALQHDVAASADTFVPKPPASAQDSNSAIQQTDNARGERLRPVHGMSVHEQGLPDIIDSSNSKIEATPIIVTSNINTAQL